MSTLSAGRYLSVVHMHFVGRMTYLDPNMKIYMLKYLSFVVTFFCLSFRDRRYEYKGLNKVWKGKLSEAKASGNPIKIQEAQVCMSA